MGRPKLVRTHCSRGHDLSVSQSVYPDGKTRCRECRKAYKAPHNKVRQYQLKWKFGLSPDQLDSLKESQANSCAICHRAVPLCVDHDHATGAVRGLLCHRCNLAIGQFEDRADLLQSAISYLQSHQPGVEVESAPAVCRIPHQGREGSSDFFGSGLVHLV